MARQPSDDTVRQREVFRDRVKFMLDYHWDGSQRQMSRDLAVSQGLISKIVNGLQGAGRGFLNNLARQPGVNAEWVLRGEGQPLTIPPKGTLPVALGILSRPLQASSPLLTGQRHPVAEALDRESRYWVELQIGSPLLRDDTLRLLAGDLLLMESDSAWTSRLDLIEGRVCGVCLNHGVAGPTYAIGKIYRDTLGLVFDALAVVLRLASPIDLLSPSSSNTDPGTAAAGQKNQSGRRRNIRMLDLEKEKAESRRKAAGQRAVTFELQDVVAVCVYLARPTPRIVQSDATGGKPAG
jgi:hypothetical protein